MSKNNEEPVYGFRKPEQGPASEVDSYADFVSRLAKPGRKIHEEMTPEDAHLIHMIMGLSGEVGELLDAIKKHTIYRKPIDLENIKEELGDIEFFLQGIRSVFGLDRGEIVDGNIHKLNKRYPSGYSNKAANERVDKS